MIKKNNLTLFLAFILSYLGVVLLPALFPFIRLIGFAPFLTLAISQISILPTLWISALAGLIIDLYSPASHIGFFAINYTLTTLLIYRFKKIFPEEKIVIFAIYTSLFSFSSTLIQFILHALIDVNLKLRVLTILTDLIIMPILDGIYALVAILIPLAAICYMTDERRLKAYKTFIKNGVHNISIKCQRFFTLQKS